jgi:hypothetical protein
MSSRRLPALFACALASALGTADANADPRDLTLRLADVGTGYLVGDDSGCGMTLSDEGAPRSLVRLQQQHPQRNCSTEFEQLWAAAEPPGPRLVESFVFEFETTAGAEAGFSLAADLAAYSFGVGRRSLDPVRPPAPLGDATAMFETDDVLIDGLRRRPGLVVVWRSGTVVALLLAGRATPAAAFSLAAAQQARIAAPTPLRDSELDDREVPLDNPRLGVPVHWLGRRFEPGGRLPPLTLLDSFGPFSRIGGPGWRADIQYRRGLTLGLWRPRAWARLRRSRLGRLVMGQPCVAKRRLRVPGGRAVVYAGHENRRESCSGSSRDVFVAHVRLRDVVVSVNVPLCFLCVDASGPYNSRAGMRAVVRGLRPRPVP